MVCPSEAGLRQEMDLLEQIQAVLAEGDRRHVMAYISDAAQNVQVTDHLCLSWRCLIHIWVGSTSSGCLWASVAEFCCVVQTSSPARHLLSEQQLHKNAAKTYTCDAKCETQVR